MMIGDDEVTSGGTGQFPGAVDFFHSVMFNNAGTVVNWVDESFGTRLPDDDDVPAAAVESGGRDATRPAGCSSPTWRASS